MSETTTFEDMGITEAPYVEEYKEKYGRYPMLQLKMDKMIPVRRMDPKTRTKKFSMIRFNSGALFQVTGTEPGKLAPINVVLTCGGHEIVLTPGAMIKILPPMMPRITKKAPESCFEEDNPWDDAPSKPEPVIASGPMGDILAKRRREAMIDI